MLGRKEIEEILPHREPFLFVDQILELDPGKKAVGLKRLTGSESFFKGHFPDYPVMPGVLIVEALAQVGAVAVLSREEDKGKIVFFAGIDKFRFKRQVRPGEELRLKVEILKSRGPIGVGKGTAYVSGVKAAEGELMFAVK